jgi:hypothetical protein
MQLSINQFLKNIDSDNLCGLKKKFKKKKPYQH